ncbi:MAG: GBS Bsp-like repeat-containing protein [Lachnospiraceae bacterium]|nr:GBS Bsp-like repeat-containing protein [Lachnospiraceae bacterium]
MIYMGSAGGDAFYAYEANVDTENLVKYRNLHGSGGYELWPSYVVYHGTNPIPPTPTDPTPPTISDIKVTDITKDGYTVTCSVSDNVGVTSVKFPSWNSDKHIGDNAEWLVGTVSGGKATCRVEISKLKSGAVQGNYMTHIYAYDAAGNSSNKPIQTVYIDRTTPVITDAKVISVDSTGYTVQCKATDNNGIARVQCPTWTVKNDQDDIDKDWGNSTAVRATDKGNGIYQFVVKISDHNNEYGAYKTHIYAYDTFGNYTNAKIDITVPDVPVLGPDGYYHCQVLPSDVTADDYIIQYKNHYEKIQKDSPGSGWTKGATVKNEWQNSGDVYQTEQELPTSDARVLVRSLYYHFCGPNAGNEGNYEQTGKFVHYDDIDPSRYGVRVVSQGMDGSHPYYLLDWADGGGRVYCQSGVTCDGSNGTHGARCQAWYKWNYYQDRVKVESYKYTKDSDWVDTKDSSANSVEIRYKEKEAHKHSYTSKVTKEATCTEEGVKTFTCTCGDSYTEAIQAKGHTVVVDKAVAATTEKTGLTEGSHCSVCGEVIKKQEVIPVITENPDEDIKVVSIAVNPSEFTLEPMEDGKITWSVLPKNATNIKVSFKSTDADVVYVYGDGTFTAVAPGEAYIVITAADGSGVSRKVHIIVKGSDEDDSEPVLKYRAYCQKKGWMPWKTAGVGSDVNTAVYAGTTNNLRMETIQMQLSGIDGAVKYRAYCAKKGWTQWATTAKTTTYAGTKGESRRVEMIQLETSGNLATKYDMYYRTYCEKFGWLGWAKSGEKSGSAGYARKLEAFQIQFVTKGTSFNRGTKKVFYDKTKDRANPK